jgi:hypothetical protein
MSTTRAETGAEGVGLSRSEAWVLHHVLTDRIEAARDAAERPPWWAVEVIGKLEANGECGPTASDQCTGAATLTCFEAWRLQRVLRAYTAEPDTPERDAAAARGIVEHLDETFEAPPETIQQ